MKKYYLILVLFCVGFSGLAASLESRYETLDKPLDIPYTIGNKKMVMHTYLANEKQRTSNLTKRILYYIYNQQFKKYGIELNEAGKIKISQLWLESCPQKEMYIKCIKSLCSSYEDVYKISLLMKEKKLTPDAAYEQYIKDNKTKLSKGAWWQLFTITSPEWREKFIKTNKADRIKLIQNSGILLVLQIRLLWEKRVSASNYDVKQAASKWEAEVNALSIEVPEDYSAVKTKVIKILQALFPPKVELLKDKNLRPAYKELKNLTNNSDLKDSDFSFPKVLVKRKPKVETRKLINWTSEKQPFKNTNVIESKDSKPVMVCPNYIDEFRKNPDKNVFSNLLKTKVITEKEAKKIASNWLFKNHGLLAEEVLIVSGLYKASRRGNGVNSNGNWIWEIKLTEFTTMLSGVILINAKDGAVDGTIINDGEQSNVSNLAIIRKRQETINQLIANFKKSNDKNYKISVISTLGKLRAIEAIPFLIRNIGYGDDSKPSKKLIYAGQALSEIGSPCIIPILDAIPKISAIFRVEHLIKVLADIHSHNLTIAHLQKKIEETKDLREKQLFEYTLERIIKHKKSREEKLLTQQDKKDETFVYGKPTFGFALAVKPQIKKYDFGNVVFAIVRIKNVSNKESSVIIHNFKLQYFFEVTDLAGKEIPKLLYQKDIDRKIKEGLSFLRIFAQPVKPGEFLEYKLNLSKRFDLTMGESYIVQGYRDIRKYDPINKKRSYSKVFSNKVKFSIK